MSNLIIKDGELSLEDQITAQSAKKLKEFDRNEKKMAEIRSFYTKKGYSEKEALAKQEAINATKRAKKQAQEEKQIWKEAQKDIAENANKATDRFVARSKLAWQENKEQFTKNLKDIGNKVLNAEFSAVSKAFRTYQDYMGKIETRLLGSAKDYKGVLQSVTTTLGASPLVSQQKVLENLNRMVEAGIVANVEQRAFLATLSERIATTFNAFDSSMLRLIRIQQADTTAARLGIESSLNKFLNRQFTDTSYLSDVGAQNISSILQNVEAQMGYQSGVAFDYAVQKWLGSLYSVGVSSNTVQSLAQGIGYLGSGDIGSLSSNSSLQTLLLLASQAAGVDYSNLLTSGFTSTSQVDKIMSGVVKTLQSISTSNQVVKAQYANLLGISLADLTAISNLNQDDIKNIAASIMDYNAAITETGDALKTIGQRTSTAEKIENAVNNMWATIGEGIYSNVGTAAAWILTDQLKASGIADDLEIPLPFGLHTNPISLLRAGIVGVGVISRLPSLVRGLFNWNSVNLDLSDATSGFSRGGREGSLLTDNVSQMLSYSSTFGTMSESEIISESMQSTEQTAAQYQGETPATKDEEAEMLQTYVGDKLDLIYTLLTGWDRRLPFSYTPGL